MNTQAKPSYPLEYIVAAIVIVFTLIRVLAA